MKRIVKGLRRLYRRYPARCNTLIAGAIVGVLGLAGVTIDAVTAKELVTLELPILLGGEATHRLVTPAHRKSD